MEFFYCSVRTHIDWSPFTRATLKGDDKLTVKVQGNGPAGAIIVDSNGRGETKGYIKIHMSA